MWEHSNVLYIQAVDERKVYQNWILYNHYISACGDLQGKQ